MRIIYTTTAFNKDLLGAKKRGWKLDTLESIVEQLRQGTKLARKHRDHDLTGNWTGFRECHVGPDRLLIYSLEIEGELRLARFGSHSDLFR